MLSRALTVFRIPGADVSTCLIQWNAPEVAHDSIPSNPDHDLVPLQRSLWCRLAVGVYVDLLHSPHHILILVARRSPRIQASVVVVREGMELGHQVVLTVACRCLCS